MEIDLYYVVLVATLTLLVILFSVFYFQRTRNFEYWKNRNIPHVKPTFPFGSVQDLALANAHIGEAYDKMYKTFSNERFFGIIDMQHPVLVLRDPDLIKSVMIKDFKHFAARTNLNTNKNNILRHLIDNMQGEEWKEMRALLSPAFTSGRIKKLYELMAKCSECLKQHILKLIENDSRMEITSLLARFSLDVIVTSAFGFETDIIDNPDCTFFMTMKTMLKTSKSRFFKRTLSRFLPFSVTLVPPEVTSLLTTTVRETVEYREKNNIRRNDFLNSLISASHLVSSDKKENNGCFSKKLKSGLSIEQMAAQVFTFFISSFSTNTSNMTFCLYELSRHQDIQERLFQDINQALSKHQGEIHYQAVQDMTYLDQVIHETLRLYGSGQTLTRICTKQYHVPDSNLTLERGARVLIPLYSLHHDSQYFPNPYNFQPERFSPEKFKEMHPCIYLPFGGGPRNCIAKHFGLLQMKLGIATVVSNFRVELSSDQEVPIKIDKRSFVVTPANRVFLRLTRREV